MGLFDTIPTTIYESINQGLSGLGQGLFMKSMVNLEQQQEKEKFGRDLFKTLVSNYPLKAGYTVPQGMQDYYEMVNSFDLTKKVMGKTEPETPYQKAQRQVMTAQLKDLSLAAKKINGLTPLIDQVETKIQDFGKISPGIRGKAEGAIGWVRGVLQTKGEGSKINAYKAYKQGVRAQLVKAMGDVGNFSESEQKAAINLIPNYGDSNETKTNKIQQLRDLISQKKQYTEGQVSDINSQLQLLYGMDLSQTPEIMGKNNNLIQDIISKPENSKSHSVNVPTQPNKRFTATKL